MHIITLEGANFRQMLHDFTHLNGVFTNLSTDDPNKCAIFFVRRKNCELGRQKKPELSDRTGLNPALVAHRACVDFWIVFTRMDFADSRS